MFCPTEPRGDSLFVLLSRYAMNLVQPDGLFAKILLNTLANQLLFAEELIPDKIKNSPMSVVTVRPYREYLPVALHLAKRARRRGVSLRYAGIKQRREPMLLSALEGA